LSFGRKLALLTLAGLGVRLLFLWLEPATHPIADERTWTNWAVENLVTSKVRFDPFRTRMIFYPPLYPYFIAVFFDMFGSLAAVKAAQTVVSALVVPAVGRVTSAAFGERAGIIAAAITAFYPDFVWFSVHFWSETLFLFFLWWAFERLLAADRLRSVPIAILAGVLFGLGILTRETSLYFTPVAALFLWVGARGERGASRAAAFFVAALVTVAPWTYRNYAVFKAFVPVSTAGGLNLYQGNARLTRQQVYDEYEAVHGRIEQYRWARRRGIEVILERQPAWIFEKLAQEMPLFWEADSLALIHIRRGAYDSLPRGAAAFAWIATVVPYLTLLAGFVAGLARLRENRVAVLLLVFLVFYNFLHVATHGFARYRMPIMPVVIAVAAFGFERLLSREREPMSPRRKLAAAAVALALGVCVAPSLVSGLRDPALGLGDAQETPREDAPPN